MIFRELLGQNIKHFLHPGVKLLPVFMQACSKQNNLLQGVQRKLLAKSGEGILTVGEYAAEGRFD
ncbi:hypothetical protein D3C76_1779580 [compost metagenome]